MLNTCSGSENFFIAARTRSVIAALVGLRYTRKAARVREIRISTGRCGRVLIRRISLAVGSRIFQVLALMSKLQFVIHIQLIIGLLFILRKETDANPKICTKL